MRPVNLMPPEEIGASGRAPMRTGSVPYVVIGVLALALLGVLASALASKQISDRESEKAQLEQDLQAATARAQSLRPFADFRAVQESRTATVTSLAQSRFDWERVMNELARVIPDDVWLVNLTGTAGPTVEVEEAADIPTRADVAGPALELIGCATSQDAVAGFIASLEDIDGVTRVGFNSSEKSEDTGAASGVTSGASEGGENEECRTRDFITKFQIVVAFDAVPAPATATTAPGVPAPLTNQSGSQPAGAESTQPQTQTATSQAGSDAQQATDVVPGG